MMKSGNQLMRSQAGFTLVELVVVMIILGILAATALPKFMSVNTQAHQAAVAGTGGAFGSAVALAHAQWVANGHTGLVDNLAGFGENDVDTTAAGWPIDTAGENVTATAARCVNLWTGLMQNPPSVAAGAGSDFLAAVINTDQCQYTYQPAAGMTIIYDTGNGSVVVDDVI